MICVNKQKFILQFQNTMTVQLSAQEQLKFSNIMFQSEGKQQQQIQNLNPQQRSKLKDLYAQKIAYETANANLKPPPLNNQSQYNKTAAPGILGTICCCFMPEQNRDKFDITSSVFMKRIFSTFLFFKGDFLKIDEGRTQLYGYLWLTITYVIILGLAANLNEYFIMPYAFKFDHNLMLRALGISAVFLIAQPFIYAAVVKCLTGSIATIQSMMLCGYSVILYFIPTLLCLIPSLYWHVCLLAVGSLFRAIFLYRNYSSKIPAKSVAILVVILIIEAVFVFTLLRVMFANDNGYNFSDGTKQVFKHQTARIFVY